ncbi:MAG: hypothetical protein AAF283_13955 [Cyanobacteria bacterium P01_A01_bin.70]
MPEIFRPMVCAWRTQLLGPAIDPEMMVQKDEPLPACGILNFSMSPIWWAIDTFFFSHLATLETICLRGAVVGHLAPGQTAAQSPSKPIQ